jgi:hypothetical protein
MAVGSDLNLHPLLGALQFLAHRAFHHP